MTDELLNQMREQRNSALERRKTLKRQMEDMLSAIQRHSNEAQRLNQARKELGEPYKAATEEVADLTAKIEAEDRRRDEEAAAKRRAEETAKRQAEEAAATVPVIAPD